LPISADPDCISAVPDATVEEIFFKFCCSANIFFEFSDISTEEFLMLAVAVFNSSTALIISDPPTVNSLVFEFIS